jgi:hypothetical protein
MAQSFSTLANVAISGRIPVGSISISENTAFRKSPN